MDKSDSRHLSSAVHQ